MAETWSWRKKLCYSYRAHYLSYWIFRVFLDSSKKSLITLKGSCNLDSKMFIYFYSTTSSFLLDMLSFRIYYKLAFICSYFKTQVRFFFLSVCQAVLSYQFQFKIKIIFYLYFAVNSQAVLSSSTFFETFSSFSWKAISFLHASFIEYSLFFDIMGTN